MEHDPPDATGDEFSVRLSWPKVVAPPKDEPATAAPAASSAAVRPSPVPRPPVAAPPVTLRGGASARPAAALEPGPGESGVAKSFVDAFDRLSDRLLDRLRVLRQDIDADLNGLRSEVAMLRQAVDDSTQGQQIRQLQATLDEVRAEVAGLRRAVLEWPELERVADEVANVRGDLSFLFDATADGQSPGPSAVVNELREVVSRLAEGVAASTTADAGQVAFLVDEVSSIRTELSAIMRRLPKNVGDDERQLDLVADAVADRLLEQLDTGGKRSKRR